MNGVWGAGLLTATVLLILWACGVYYQPDPPAWTQNKAATAALSIIVIAGLGLSLGVLVTGYPAFKATVAGLEAPDYIVGGIGGSFLAYLAWRLGARDALVEVPASNPRRRFRRAEPQSLPATDHLPAQAAGPKGQTQRAA